MNRSTDRLENISNYFNDIQMLLLRLKCIELSTGNFLCGQKKKKKNDKEDVIAL